MSEQHDCSREPGDAVPHILRKWLSPFRFWFTAPSWEHLLVLVMGALLSPGKRTVTACLRITGRAEVSNFAAYHQLLNRARWNSRTLAARLLSVIVARLVPEGPVGIGMDDTIERRWGQRIAARGIYRDPVRSSHGHFVKASGLRWLSFMVLSPVPWAKCIKALPVLTILCPSERHDQKKGRKHKLLTDWARQGVLQLCRWLPGREIIFVGDSSFAVHTLAAALPDTATLITRLRLDASLFAPPDQRHEHTLGRPAQKGRPLPKLKTLLKDAKTEWQRIVASSWYGKQTDKTLDVTSGTGLWYRRGTPPRPIRWVLVRDPSGRREPQAFMSTNSTLSPLRSLPISFGAGRSRSPSPKRERILAWKPNGSGTTKPSCARPRRCWRSTASSHSGHAICSVMASFPMPPPGTRKQSSPSPMPSVRFA
ncbi:transposase [Sinorhizobium meliloti]|nr:transposase [Sinorhizobium meliloti]